MQVTSQFVSRSRRPLRSIIGAIALLLGFAHAWLGAMHFTQHQVNARAFEFAFVGVLVPLLIALAIAGRRRNRDWNRVALWFLLWSVIILPFLTHVKLAA